MGIRRRYIFYLAPTFAPSRAKLVDSQLRRDEMKVVGILYLLIAILVLVYAYIPANAVDHDYSSDTDKSSHLQLYGDVRSFNDDSISLQMSGEDTNGTTSGFIVHFSEQNATTQSYTQSPWLAFISCDSNSTDSTDDYDIFSFAADRGARAVLLYTTTKERCEINPVFLQTYNRVIDVFATSSRDSARLIDNQFDVNSTYYWYNSQIINDTAKAIEDNPSMRVPYLLATLSAYNATQPPSQPGPVDEGSQDNQDQPSNTSLAMIVLYVIIAVVTILFMIVILSGAFRAARNPQRYGERPARREVLDTLSGQTVIVEDRGQTRAGGIARAILETFPLVNFNNELRTSNKADNSDEARDIEMGESHHGDDSGSAHQSPKEPIKEVDGEGPRSCSICYEDFEQGEQLRILPCNAKHCFHAKCVDPWLLDVQGACPLCRQDFRAQTVQSCSNRPTTAETSTSNDSSNANITDPRDFPPLTTGHLANRRQASLLSLRTMIRSPFRRQRQDAEANTQEHPELQPEENLNDSSQNAAVESQNVDANENTIENSTNNISHDDSNEISRSRSRNFFSNLLKHNKNRNDHSDSV
ncbi:hypothetical protein E3Q16_01789 [Wallemia mellicola]|nr:hypothetical protein E3Q16_01789 [Wallemia mellicola]TIC18036.1 hypothetical protein E3Q15_00261 [Wallemia mellicola]TIC57481.1 hypothetical protein E3Q04_00462 [Wallemia mellicola]TIC59545.1 hypothetical protein E3Q05_00054 [Wallemia mellicola]